MGGFPGVHSPPPSELAAPRTGASGRGRAPVRAGKLPERSQGDQGGSHCADPASPEGGQAFPRHPVRPLSDGARAYFFHHDNRHFRSRALDADGLDPGIGGDHPGPRGPLLAGPGSSGGVHHRGRTRRSGSLREGRGDCRLRQDDHGCSPRGRRGGLVTLLGFLLCRKLPRRRLRVSSRRGCRGIPR